MGAVTTFADRVRGAVGYWRHAHAAADEAIARGDASPWAPETCGPHGEKPVAWGIQRGQGEYRHWHWFESPDRAIANRRGLTRRDLTVACDECIHQALHPVKRSGEYDVFAPVLREKFYHAPRSPAPDVVHRAHAVTLARCDLQGLPPHERLLAAAQELLVTASGVGRLVALASTPCPALMAQKQRLTNASAALARDAETLRKEAA